MDLLTAGARDLQITLELAHIEAFRRYYKELINWNEKFNLTAITDYKNAQIRHFLDSLSCLLALESAGRLTTESLIDVGTGAGFPGIPLKVLRPGIELTLVESTRKKTDFLKHLIKLLDLQKVTVLHARAETLGQDPVHRERYDWAVARAVADMKILAEYLLPLTRVGGKVLAQKSEDAAAEVQLAENAIVYLGGRVQQLVPVEMRGLAERRYLVVLNKLAATPEKYPRRPGMPSKRPLEG